MFKVPGFGAILSAFNCTPGTIASCTADLQEGNLLGLSPGGVYEALFSDHKEYKVLWKSRVGFAKIALDSKVPVFPIFTRNIREAVRTLSFSKRLMRAVYSKIRLPCAPIYGGFPVKLTTYIGDPIELRPEDTPESFRDKCRAGVEELIRQHQRLPGSIWLALFERFGRKRHTS